LYGQLLPATIGGDIVRATLLANKVTLRTAVVSTLADRLTGLAVLVLMILAQAPLIAWRLGGSVQIRGLAALGLPVLVGVASILVWFTPSLARYLPAPFHRLVERTMTWREAMLRASLGVTVVGLSILLHLAAVTQIYLLAQSAGVHLLPLDCILLVPPALLLSALPISINGWGVREGALASAFALIGVPPTDMVTVSILYGLTGPAMGLVFGAQALLRLRR
jgi:hypothetical protein